jgi:hypothetical protein
MTEGTAMRAQTGTQFGSLLVAVVMALCLISCGSESNGSPTSVVHPEATLTPAPTPTDNPNGVPTPGVPCKGGEWGKVITSVGTNIPLPPQTVRGTGENFDVESSGWDGQYISLCTGGTIDGITEFISDHMTQLGWNYGPPIGGCTCSAYNVWTRANDPRQVQFEQHPSEHNGQVRWGVICYRKGVFSC